jgi:hypothetical protein
MPNNDSENQDRNETPSADEIIEALAQEMGVDDAADASEDGEAAAGTDPAIEPPTLDVASEADSVDVPLDDEPSDDVPFDDVLLDDVPFDDVPFDDVPSDDVPSDDVPSDDEPEGAPPARGDNMAGLDGIFDVPGASTPKKKRAASSPKKAASSGAGGLEDIFDVGSAAAPEPERDYDPLVDDADFTPKGGATTKILVGVIVLLVVGMVVGGLVITGKMDDVFAVVQGTHRDKLDAEKRRIEAEHRAKMLAALKKYGELTISGAPDRALVRMQFEGDPAPRIVYAPFAPGSPYAELRLPVIFKNLEVDQALSVLVDAPGYRSNQLTVNEDKWSQRGLRDYTYSTTVYLEAQSGMQSELIDRMEAHDEDFYGTLIIESNPPGAFVKINGLQVFADGRPARTPMTLKELPKLTKAHVDTLIAKAATQTKLCAKAGGAVCQEAEAFSEKAKKLQEKLEKAGTKKSEPKLIKVNTPPGFGHKVELWFDDSAMPRYITAVNRSLWTCKLKSSKDLGRIKEDARAIERCESYTYRIAAKDHAAGGEPRPVSVADFEAIKEDVKRRKALELEMAQQAAESERLKKEAMEALGKGAKK